MKNFLHPFFFATVCAMVFYCCGTKANGSKINDPAPFEKLVFHSSRCFGFCPQIDMQIDNNRNIIVNREFYLSKSGRDSVNSGHFKGVLDTASFNQLLNVLKASDYKKLKFPDVQCCDGVIVTIIVYSGGERTYLKSMTPLEEAADLISFLKKLGIETKLDKTTEDVVIEE